MQPQPTVFVVDDDPAVLKAVAGVIEVLELRPEVCPSADEFLKAYRRHGPACLVLDVRMPGLSGLELQKELLAIQDPLPIIFITGHADVRTAVEAMEQGAFGFLEKPFRMHELCEKIQQAISRDQQYWHRQQQRENLNHRLAQLTPAERRVLDRIVAGGTNKLIGEELGISVRTVEVHRARMMRKLAVKSRAALLQFMAAAGTL